jgi:hypothetical protein
MSDRDNVTPYEDTSDEISLSSRYNRPPPPVDWRIAVVGLVIGIALGLYYTWYINPVVEVETRPAQLEPAAQSRFIAAIALSFAHDSDLPRTLERLLTVTQSNNPFAFMAETACDLVQRGHANSNAGFREVRSMVTLYQLQGQSGCADGVVLAAAPPTQEVSVVLPTPTPAPVASKTPTVAPTRFPTPTLQVAVPTAAPVRQYVLINVATFCDTEASGVIEVFVQDFNGSGIPGQPIRVRWDDGDDTFYTGLKPERGAAYADFEMESGESYIIEMPDRSEPSIQQLVAVPCTTEEGAGATTSYRVVFRPTS